MENMGNIDISNQAVDISNQAIDISKTVNQTMNKQTTPCPKHSVHANGGMDASCVECPIINGSQLGVVGMHGICAFSNNIYEKGYVEYTENGEKCSNILDTPISIRGDNKQYCISNTIMKNSSGLDKFNAVRTPTNMTYYQTI